MSIPDPNTNTISKNHASIDLRNPEENIDASTKKTNRVNMKMDEAIKIQT